jgi:small subunit ribosomal protein S15
MPYQYTRLAPFSLSWYYHPHMLSVKTKSSIISEHRVHQKDTGSANVQIALITRQIDELASHLKKHPKDNHSRRGLLKMVGGRRRLMQYLKKHDTKGYTKLAKSLSLKVA